jgi:hypothetical protein
MPLEAKPLFRPDVLRSHWDEFLMPPETAATRQMLSHWAELIGSNRIDRLGEQQILPDFLSDIFIALLGYVSPAGGSERYTISREQHV